MSEAMDVTMAEPSLDLKAPVEPVLGLRGLEVDDDLVLVDVLTDRSFRLNRSGRWIWMQLQKPCTLGGLVDELQSEYGLERSYAQEVIVEYLGRLQELRVIAIQERDRSD